MSQDRYHWINKQIFDFDDRDFDDHWINYHWKLSFKSQMAGPWCHLLLKRAPVRLDVPDSSDLSSSAISSDQAVDRLRRTGSWTKDRPGQIDNSLLLKVREDPLGFMQVWFKIWSPFVCRKDQQMTSRETWTSSMTTGLFRRTAAEQLDALSILSITSYLYLRYCRQCLSRCLDFPCYTTSSCFG